MQLVQSFSLKIITLKWNKYNSFFNSTVYITPHIRYYMVFLHIQIGPYSKAIDSKLVFLMGKHY